MKKILMLLLLVSSSVFSQAEKDSLLLLHKEEVDQQLKLMFYLDKINDEYCRKTVDERAESNKTFPLYFSNTIVKNNPTSLDIKEYIGEFSPVNWENFMEAVYEKNILEYIALTERYGYLSYKRMGKQRKKTDIVEGVVVFVERTKSQDKEIKKLINQEKKIGNIPERDYEYLKFILKRKSSLTTADYFKLKEIGIIMQFEDN